MTETERARHAPPAGKPVVCGHRGFKSKYPENTLLSFNSAVSDGGVRVVETDLQVSKDNVLLINHDVETGRTYNADYNIRETNYDPELKSVKNLSPPHESLLTFHRALQWLVKKNSEVGNVKFMLDIKRVNPIEVLDLTVAELLKVEPDITYWHDKIIFGLWTLEYYDHGVKTGLLDNFEVINITFSMNIARAFLNKSATYEKEIENFKAPISGISLLHIATWGGNHDDTFIKFYEHLVNQVGKKLYLWTCNDLVQNQFYYQLGISGFLTDYPDQVTELINSGEPGQRASNLYEFYRLHDPINFRTKQGLKNYGIYKIYKTMEYAMMHGYLTIKVPVLYGGKYTVGSYTLSVMKFLGIV